MSAHEPFGRARPRERRPATAYREPEPLREDLAIPQVAGHVLR
jgi:hypothetical protein